MATDQEATAEAALAEKRLPSVKIIDAEKEKEGEPINDFEDILQYVGGWNRYQLHLLLIFFPFTMFLAYVSYTPILFLYVPHHWCTPDPVLINSSLTEDEVLHLSIPPGDEENQHLPRAQCHMYQADWEQVIEDGIMDPNTSWPIIPCQQGWEFNYTGFFSSAATEMGWICEDAWRGAFTQSMFSAGGMVGCLIFGYTSDVFGRYKSFLVSNIILFITGIATPFCTNFVSFTIIRFLMGLTYNTFFASFYLLTLEYVNMDKRTVIGNLSLAVGFTLGGLYSPWLLQWLGEWKTLHHILFAQTAIIFITPWFVHESVRWLGSRGNVEKSIKVLKSIAKVNRKDVPDEIYESFKRMVEKQNQNRGPKTHWWHLFKTPRLRKNTLLTILTWMIIAGLFDAHIRNIANLNFSIYITFTISNLLELPADLIAIWGIDNFGRRWSACISILLSGICMIVCGLVMDYPMAVIVMSMWGRFFITYAMNTGFQMIFEVMPTRLRGQGSALASIFGQAAQFGSPYIVYSAIVNDAMPFYILGILGVVGSLVPLTVPETADVDLPNTLEEAENFGKGQRFFAVPIVDRMRAEKKRRAAVAPFTERSASVFQAPTKTV